MVIQNPKHDPIETRHNVNVAVQKVGQEKRFHRNIQKSVNFENVCKRILALNQLIVEINVVISIQQLRFVVFHQDAKLMQLFVQEIPVTVDQVDVKHRVEVFQLTIQRDQREVRDESHCLRLVVLKNDVICDSVCIT